MASFLILVHNAPYANQSARSALLYANAVIGQGHQLKAIFFYQDGVYQANTLAVIPSDELDTRSGFQRLHLEQGIPLMLCVTAAQKRGILDQQQAQYESLAHFNCDPCFTVAGLAEMAEIAASCDRLIQFK